MDQIISEMRYTHEQYLAFADALDSKLSLLLESGAGIVTLFTAVGIVRASPTVYWIGLGIVVAAYLVAVVYVTVHWAPWRYPFPFPVNWQQLAAHYMPLSDDELRDITVNQYLIVIQKIDVILDKKSTAVKVGLIALSAALAFLVMLQFAISAAQ